MIPFRPPFRTARALELSHHCAPRQVRRLSTSTNRKLQFPRRCMSDLLTNRKFQYPRRYRSDPPPEKKPDPLEEWRNPKPSKWPNRIRLMLLPFLGALIHSMVWASDG